MCSFLNSSWPIVHRHFAYGLLRNLLSPTAPTSKTLTEIIGILDGLYDPLPLEIVKRFKFNSRVRYASKSVADYIIELRKLAKYCNYGDSLDMMLHDRIYIYVYR